MPGLPSPSTSITALFITLSGFNSFSPLQISEPTGVSFATGFIGYGLADKAGKLLSASRSVGQVATKYKYATSIATNAFVDGGVGATVQVGTNVLTGQNWSDNVWETATSQAFFGGAGNAITRGTGAAWNKYTRLNRVGNQLDNMAAETQDLIRQLDDNFPARSTTPTVNPTQCFVAGTEIQTIDGTKNIEDIHVGDWVLSDDPTTVGEIEYKQVLNTFVKQTSSLIDVYIDGEKITTTEEHPFWVPDVGWVAAKDLHAGSLLQTKYESWLDVDRVVKHSGLTTVYNFEVQGFHTYFVSDLGLLVHNTCGNLVFSGDVRDLLLPDNPVWPSSSSNPWFPSRSVTIGATELNHANLGDFTDPIRANNFTTRLKNGGHGQDNILALQSKNITYNILHEFDNGVRTGNLPKHKQRDKKVNVGQSWFPENWRPSDIKSAGKYVAELHRIDDLPSGSTLFGNYNGVRVGVMVTDGKPDRIGSIFPDNTYQPSIDYPTLLVKNPFIP